MYRRRCSLKNRHRQTAFVIQVHLHTGACKIVMGVKPFGQTLPKTAGIMIIDIVQHRNARVVVLRDLHPRGGISDHVANRL